jgi:glycosyltransferase involved in cell wall biosynthesis
MERKNKFIIITPSYNNEEWVETYYNSIDVQTYDNYKVIYINDNSNDNTQYEIERLTQNNSKFTIINHKENKGASYNYIEYLPSLNLDSEDVLVHLDGDDWLAYPTTLENLNDFYNKNDFWMTYGKLITYPNLELGNPQNTPYSNFVKKHKLYRKDQWRASHLRTYKYFLFSKIENSDLKSKYTQDYFWHASDLSWAFPCLEMCPPDKIGVLDEISYVYNTTGANRTQERENPDNIKFEIEIRNKKIYKTLFDKSSPSEKFPQVNTYGDNKERHSIPKTFTYIYNSSGDEYDITILQDDSILDYLNNKIFLNSGKPVVAILAEGPHLFNQKLVYSKVIENYKKFNLILGWHESLHFLPNFKFRPLTEISQWNLLPIELDINNFKIYDKTKLISFITSNKNMCEGHRFRLSCMNKVKDLNVDIYGRGINPISSKLEGLKDYYYSITMENAQMPFYFTEKIIDCFLSGTIPIYYGCANIKQYFNSKGIITFNNELELTNIINNLSPHFYENNFDAVEENYKLALEMWEDNDRFFSKNLINLL